MSVFILYYTAEGASGHAYEGAQIFTISQTKQGIVDFLKTDFEPNGITDTKENGTDEEYQNALNEEAYGVIEFPLNKPFQFSLCGLFYKTKYSWKCLKESDLSDIKVYNADTVDADPVEEQPDDEPDGYDTDCYICGINHSCEVCDRAHTCGNCGLIA